MLDSRIPLEFIPLLQEFADELQSRLSNKVLGLYIQGSIALNGFDDVRSDIDFIVVLKGSVTNEELSLIANIHQELRSKHPSYMVSEGQYTSPEHLNKTIKVAEKRYPKYFYGEPHGLRDGFIDTTSLWILKHHGITVFGPAINSLNISADWQELKNAMKYNLHVYWADKAKKVENFVEDRWIDDTILTLGRIVYTLENKSVITKEQGGYYLLQILPHKWHRIINEALRIRKGLDEPHYTSIDERAFDTQQLIAHVTDLCNEKYKLM